MKSKTASVTRNLLGAVLAIAFFGAICTQGAIQHAKSAVGPASSEKVQQADGSGPPPPPQLPTPARNAIA